MPGASADSWASRSDSIQFQGLMLIDSNVAEQEPVFGIDQRESPRLVVVDDRAEILGTWSGTRDPAFARTSSNGMTSVFVGCAPIPIETVRRLCLDAGVRLWSTRPDVVVASRDWAMVVATSEGDRTVQLHRPLRSLDDGSVVAEFGMYARRGEVRLFGPPEP